MKILSSHEQNLPILSTVVVLFLASNHVGLDSYMFKKSISLQFASVLHFCKQKSDRNFFSRFRFKGYWQKCFSFMCNLYLLKNKLKS